jgi:hypothetical protein
LQVQIPGKLEDKSELDVEISSINKEMGYGSNAVFYEKAFDWKILGNFGKGKHCAIGKEKEKNSRFTFQ